MRRRSYLDNVFPDAMGVRKPFYFFLVPSFWTGADDACCGSGGKRRAAAQRWEMTRAAVKAKMAIYSHNDPSLTGHLLSTAEMISDAMTSLVTVIPGVSLASSALAWTYNLTLGTLHYATDSAQQLNIYKTVVEKCAKVHLVLLWLADIAERSIALFTWRDEALTAVFCGLCIVVGLAASFSLAAAATLLGALGVGWNHVTLAFGCLLLHPACTPATLSILTYIDWILGFLVVGKSVLPPFAAEQLKRDRVKPLTGEALRAAVEADAEKETQNQLRKRSEELLQRGDLRQISLSQTNAREWLPRLLARAPNELRRQHCVLAAASNRAAPPPPELAHSSSSHILGASLANMAGSVSATVAEVFGMRGSGGGGGDSTPRASRSGAN